MKRLLLWGLVALLFATPCYAADTKMSELADGSATIAGTWYGVGYNAGTSYRFTINSLLALKIGTVTEAKVCLGDAAGKIQCITNAYQAAGWIVQAGANNVTTFTGNYSLGLTLSGNTSLTLPTSGTLATTTFKPADLAIASQAAGDILYFDGTNWVRLAKDAGKYLKSGASAVSWDTPASAFDPASPGAIGGTTPAAGTFTGITVGAGGITTAASASPTNTYLDSDAPGADKEVSKTVGGYVDGADGAENGTLDLYVHQAGTSTSYFQIDGKNARINVSKTLALGANNITMTGSIGATGAGKVTKVWAVDAEFTNPPTINAGTIAAGALLTGYSSGAGTVAGTDTILQGINKLNGNTAAKAPIASPSFTGVVTVPGAPDCPTIASTSQGTANINIDGASACDYNYSNGASAATYTPVITAPPAANKVRYITITLGGGAGVVTLTATNITWIGTAGAAATTTNKKSTYVCIIPASGNALCKIVAEAY